MGVYTHCFEQSSYVPWCYGCTRGKLIKPFCERLKDHIPSFLGDLDVDCRLHPLVCVESMLPKGLPRSGTPSEEMIMDIWFTIINCLQGQMDDVCGHSDDVVTTRLHKECFLNA